MVAQACKLRAKKQQSPKRPKDMGAENAIACHTQNAKKIHLNL